jgi:hypothetical protein
MDPLDEFAALEASSAAAIPTAPVSVPTEFLPEPEPGTTVNITVNPFESPAQAPVQQEAPAPVQVQQPVQPVEPQVVTDIPDKLQRRIYLHEGISDEQRLVAQLIGANPGLDMNAIMAAANAAMGRAPVAPQPVAPAQVEASPTVVAAEQQTTTITVDGAKTRLAQIKAELKNLDSVVDSQQFNALQDERSDLLEQLPFMVQEQQTAQQQRSIQEAQEAEQIDAFIAQSRADTARDYPQLSADIWDKIQDPSVPLTAISDPFAQAYAAQVRQDQATNAPTMQLPNYEQITAALVAQQLGVLPVARAQQPAAPARVVQQPAPAPTGYQPQVVMPAISGQQHTSADRVTTQPTNPLANIQAELQQAVAAENYDEIERLNGLMAGGPAPQTRGPSFSISYAG